MTYPLRRYPTHLIDVLQVPGGTGAVVRPAAPQDEDTRRAFRGDRSDEAPYYRFMTGFGDLPEAMAELLTDAGATMIRTARRIVDASVRICGCRGRRPARHGLSRILLTRLADHAAFFDIRQIGGDTIAAKTAMMSLAKRTGLARKPEDRRLVHLLEGLPADNQDATVSRGPFGECVAVA